MRKRNHIRPRIISGTFLILIFSVAQTESVGTGYDIGLGL